LLAACGAPTQNSPPSAALQLGGTSWQLVKFQGGDDKTLAPDDRAKYTITFGTDGAVSARIDCNRGRGTWKSAGPNQLQFGPLALTRAMCRRGLHDQIVKHWDYIRSYIIKDGHLFLSLMADGGIYEFEPIPERNRLKGSRFSMKLSDRLRFLDLCPVGLISTSVVFLRLLYISKTLKTGLRVTLNPSTVIMLNEVKHLRVDSVKGLMYLKRRDSSLRSE
jgi:hypothetical protein